MKVVYEKVALKELQRIPKADQVALRRKLLTYAKTREGDVVKLTGANEWRLRHGDWRAVFVIKGNIIVIRIAHRREVYR